MAKKSHRLNGNFIGELEKIGEELKSVRRAYQKVRRQGRDLYLIKEEWLVCLPDRRRVQVSETGQWILSRKDYALLKDKGKALPETLRRLICSEDIVAVKPFQYTCYMTSFNLSFIERACRGKIEFVEDIRKRHKSG